MLRKNLTLYFIAAMLISASCNPVKDAVDDLNKEPVYLGYIQKNNGAKVYINKSTRGNDGHPYIIAETEHNTANTNSSFTIECYMGGNAAAGEYSLVQGKSNIPDNQMYVALSYPPDNSRYESRNRPDSKAKVATNDNGKLNIKIEQPVTLYKTIGDGPDSLIFNCEVIEQ